MKRIYFLSDAHLGVNSPEHESMKERLMLSLLDDVRVNGEALFILGDLFDFWFEYKYVLPRGYHNILASIGSLVENDVSVTYMAGNHDFAIGDFFARELGVAVISDDYTFTFDNRSFYVFHGDGLVIKDRGYQIIKRILRNSLAQLAFKWLHPDVGFALARLVSHTSRGYTNAKYYGNKDGMRFTAEKRISNGIDYVVMGHRHVPSLEQIGNGYYVNLGDWINHYSYAVYDEGRMKLFTYRNMKPEQLY